MKMMDYIIYNTYIHVVDLTLLYYYYYCTKKSSNMNYFFLHLEAAVFDSKTQINTHKLNYLYR